MISPNTLTSFTFDTGRSAVQEYFRPIGTVARWISRLAKLPAEMRQQSESLKEMCSRQEQLHSSLDLFVKALEETQKNILEIQIAHERSYALLRELVAKGQPVENRLAAGVLSTNVGVGSYGSLYEQALSFGRSIETQADMVLVSPALGDFVNPFSYVEALPVQLGTDFLQEAIDHLSKALKAVDDASIRDHMSKAAEVLQQHAKQGEAVVELSISQTSPRKK